MKNTHMCFLILLLLVFNSYKSNNYKTLKINTNNQRILNSLVNKNDDKVKIDDDIKLKELNNEFEKEVNKINILNSELDAIEHPSNNHKHDNNPVNKKDDNNKKQLSKDFIPKRIIVNQDSQQESNKSDSKNNLKSIKLENQKNNKAINFKDKATLKNKTISKSQNKLPIKQYLRKSKTIDPQKETITVTNTVEDKNDKKRTESVISTTVSNTLDPPKVPDYTTEKVGNDAIENLKDFKYENKNCEVKSGVISFVLEKNKKKRHLSYLPVRAILNKKTLSIYLDKEDNSIRDSIRLDEITIISKIYGLKVNCVELSSGPDNALKSKSLSLCFKDDNDLSDWVKGIKDMKRCYLTFVEMETQKLIKDYLTMKFLQDQQFDLDQGKGKEDKAQINEKLKDLYYSNNVKDLSRTQEVQEKLMNQILDDLLAKSMQEEAKSQSRERQGNTEVTVQKTDSTTTITLQKKVDNTVQKIEVKQETKSARTKSKEDLERSLRSGDDFILKELKEASFRVTTNICINKNHRVDSSGQRVVSEEDFRRKVCSVLKQESNNKIDCVVDDKTKFCNVCCGHISSSNEKFREECIGDCSK